MRPLITLAVALGLSVFAHAIDKVALDVDVKTVGKASDGDAKSAETEQARALQIKVMNHTREELPNLEVKYTFFGFDLEGGELKKLETQSKSVSLVSAGSTVFDSEKSTFNYSRAHAEKMASPGGKGGGGSGGKGKGGSQPKYKRVEATGTRYAGWAVQVFQGAAMVGEAYSSLEVKKKL